MIMRGKRVFGKERVRKRPLDGINHGPDNSEKRRTSTAYPGRNIRKYNASSDESVLVPIPGVKEVQSYWDGQECTKQFSRPEEYIKQANDEVSYALMRRSANYDMDDEDEDWLIKFNNVGNNLSDETFELIIDAFEKAFFCCPDEYNIHMKQVPVSLCSDLCSEDVAAAVYSYWLKKRKRRKSALVRVFEVHKVKKPRGRPKKQKQIEGERRIPSETMMALASEDAVKIEQDVSKLAAAEETARVLCDLAVEKRNKAQSAMTQADWLMYKANMALRIAEEAQIRESLDARFRN